MKYKYSNLTKQKHIGVDVKLRKQPETELEHWQAIESLGGYIWSTNHNMSHGRIENSDEIQASLASARDITNQLVKEISVKFGVISPDKTPKVNADEKTPPAPKGKIYYWEWYNKMKRISYQAEYDTLICSACPLSNGLDKFIALGQIPCSAFSGSIYQVNLPHICAMTTYDNWKNDKLFAEIIKAGGKKALTAFKKKQKKLIKAGYKKKAS